MPKTGPIPKRSDLRRRTNKDSLEGLEKVNVEDLGVVYQPEADEKWHPLAKDLWRSMGESGQSRWYEPTDWAYAAVVMDDLSHYLRTKSRSGMKLSALLTAMGPLLLTEGERRRARLELERNAPEPGGEDPTVAIMEHYRRQAQ